MIVGSGEHKYECEHEWGTLPSNAHYGGASHGIAFDSAGSVYITHQGSPGSVFVFDPVGRFVRSLGDFHVVDGQGKGHGIDIRNEDGTDYVYLAPDDPQLGWTKMTTEGEVLWSKRAPEECVHYKRQGAVCRPTNTSFTPDGGYLLGDGYGSHFLHQYDQHDNYLRSIGGTGDQPGQLDTPHGHWLDDRDGTAKIVVADRGNARLQYFSLTGSHLGFVEDVLFPCSIDIRNDVMVVADLHSRVTLFDKANNVICHLGDDAEWRRQIVKPGYVARTAQQLRKPGRFIYPHDAAIDAEGNIFVTEWVRTGRVTRLRRVT